MSIEAKWEWLRPMNRLHGVLCGLVFCAPTFAATPQSWDFVVSVGGMSVGEPVLENGVWSLPIQADVSGLESFTFKPTALNSTLVCARVAAKIIAKDIFLTIYSDLPGVAKSARCPATQLG